MSALVLYNYCKGCPSVCNFGEVMRHVCACVRGGEVVVVLFLETYFLASVLHTYLNSATLIIDYLKVIITHGPAV